jgi:hypothetical protein
MASNPYNKGAPMGAWYEGYNAAKEEFSKGGRRKMIVDECHEQFVNELYQLAQQYGGERFTYTAAYQEELERLHEAAEQGVKNLGSLASRIQMNY